MSAIVDDSYAYCKRLSRRRAGNFYFSFLTLPSDRFRDMCALYAFMRICDDLGDDGKMPVGERRGQLQRWRAQLERALDADEFEHPVFPALAEVVRRHQIPREHLHAVIQGVEADLEPTGFETFDELAGYCYLVAGAVGLCCIHIWGFRGEKALEFAVDCGTAFQLTNILRDLGEDADMGRVYLPREDLERFGYSQADIAARRRDERFERLMRFEVDRAAGFYRKAERLFDLLEPPGRPIYAAMLEIYGRLLAEIERRGYDVYSRRVSLSRPRKLWIALRATLRHRWAARFDRSRARHGALIEAARVQRTNDAP